MHDLQHSLNNSQYFPGYLAHHHDRVKLSIRLLREGGGGGGGGDFSGNTNFNYNITVNRLWPFMYW